MKKMNVRCLPYMEILKQYIRTINLVCILLMIPIFKIIAYEGSTFDKVNQVNLQSENVGRSKHQPDTDNLNEEIKDVEKQGLLKESKNKSHNSAVVADKDVTGIVKDSDGTPLPGVTVYVKGTSIGVVTNSNGEFTLSIPGDSETLVFSFVGMKTQEILVEGQSSFNIVMVDDTVGIQDVVVVGYGRQKKESIVGAIGQASQETLERRGGVTNISSALSGQIAGLNVLETTGEPGVNDPVILIRGQSTWNESYPLVLVDGVERGMNDLDVSEVESVSVLKDASATAVFGVKGANGVILITTKRGKAGKAKMNFGANIGLKSISKIFGVMDSYEGLGWVNEAIEHEVSVYESSWVNYLPYEQLQRYKRPQEEPYSYLYPNVDWQDVITKDFAKAYRVNMNISGGTKSSKYFGSLAYVREGDILASGYNDLKGYDPGYSYDRFNFRGNLDFDLTKTTKLAVNLSGYTGIKKETNTHSTKWIYSAMYNLAPDVFPVRYPDGNYGMNPNGLSVLNPIAILQETGVKKTQRSQITSDIKLDQKLDFITKGLSVSGKLSYDLYSQSSGPNISDGGNQGQVYYKYIDPSILDAKTAADSLNAITYFPSGTSHAINEFDFVYQPWEVNPASVNNGQLARTLFYQLSLNYARTFKDHDISALMVLNRREFASGSEFKHYREDWVGRITYNFKQKYLLEFNGAYNGSEKFGPGYRFGFFPSAALGWMVSEESFLNYDWLDRFKLRASVGKVGSDAGIPRWGYIGSWIYGGGNMQAYFGRPDGTDVQSPYVNYREGTIPNPNLNWETAIKRNFGVEMGFLKNAIAVNIDVFKDDRKDIFLSGGSRNIPVTFGASPVPVNYGKTTTQGYEIELKLRKEFRTGIATWASFNMTRAKDEIILHEDPEMLPAYQKRVGYQIGQTKTTIRTGYLNNWDDVYGSVGGDNNAYKLPGDWGVVDYNADGVINTYDNVPFGYPDRPQNSYSTTLGVEYGNFSFMVQFYGVSNIHRSVNFGNPRMYETIVSEYYRDYWTPENTDAYYKAPRFLTYNESPSGDFSYFDASFLRLKTAEVSYNVPGRLLKPIGLTDLRIYINGNNLFFWSDLPQDQETGSFDIYNSYPMFKQFNFGINLGF